MFRRQTTAICLLFLYAGYLLLANTYEILAGQFAVVTPQSGTLRTVTNSLGGERRSSRYATFLGRSSLSYDGHVIEADPLIERSQAGISFGNTGRGLSHRQMLHVIDDVSLPKVDDREPRIWPKPFSEETDDRIIAQLSYIPRSRDRADRRQPVTSYKTILVYNNQEPNLISGSHVFADCPVTRCAVSKNVAMATEADAILFQNGVPERIPETKPANQIWILYLLEAPLHTQSLHDLNGLINWTATYRRDSTLVTPYEKFVLNDVPWQDGGAGPLEVIGRPLAKTKKVAWFVSNCYTANGRSEYVRELEKYIPVDIYGDCGRLKCPRGRGEQVCYEMLRDDYYFYLAFENSNCRDYITEKLFHNALVNHVVPIVMGASREDYRKVAPPGSFIHVDDFASPYQLARYLHYLTTNHTAYLEYFSWQGTGTFIDTKFWCRMCSLLHATDNHVTWYDDIEAWWHGPDVCRTSRGGQKWASWTLDQRSKRPRGHK